MLTLVAPLLSVSNVCSRELQIPPVPAPAICKMHPTETITSRTSSPPPRSDDRGFDVLNYDLDFRLDPATSSIDGEVAIKLIFLEALDEPLELDLVGELNCSNVSSAGLTLTHHQQDESLLITLPYVPAQGDTMTINVAWEGQPPRHGQYYAGLLFRTLTQGTTDPSDDVPIIASISEPWSAHAWWPCKDHLADKAIFTASITVPDTLVAVSNGNLTQTTPAEPGWQMFHWEEEFPMPTYLFCVAVSKYFFWNESCAVESAWTGYESIPLEYYFFPDDVADATIDLEPSCQMMQMLTSMMGPYPFRGEKYAQVEIKWVGAMEHTTATSISQYLLTGDHRYENIIVHEMSHHWFGDSLTPKTWSDIWLNEGFARYSEALWVEHAYGQQEYAVFMDLIGRHSHSDLFLGDGILADPDPILPNLLIYDKGAWVLHMLRQLIGDEDFFAFLHNYAQDVNLALNSVTTADMIAVAEITSGQNLEPFFTPWLETDLAPTLQVQKDIFTTDGGPGPGPFVRVEIKQLQEPLFTMAVPIRLHTAGGVINEKIIIRDRETLWRWTAPSTIDSVSIEPDKLALFNLGSVAEAAMQIEGPRPNPATSNGTDFFFSIKEAGSLSVNLYDIRGQRLGSFDGGFYEANNESSDPPHIWHWSGMTTGNRPAPAGVYWLEFLIAGARQVHKVVNLP